jgi:hypothetical protein
MPARRASRAIEVRSRVARGHGRQVPPCVLADRSHQLQVLDQRRTRVEALFDVGDHQLQRSSASAALTFDIPAPHNEPEIGDALGNLGLDRTGWRRRGARLSE